MSGRAGGGGGAAAPGPMRCSSRTGRTSARRVYEALAPGDVVLTLGAGDITRVGPELVRWLGAA